MLDGVLPLPQRLVHLPEPEMHIGLVRCNVVADLELVQSCVHLAELYQHPRLAVSRERRAWCEIAGVGVLL